MRVFVTGATGYIGAVIIEKLKAAGHVPASLARSDTAARTLAAAAVGIVRGDLCDLGVLRIAASNADAVIHAARVAGEDAGQVDRAAVQAMLAGLDGKPLIYSSGVWVMGATGDSPAGEDWPLAPPLFMAWRPAVEQLVLAAGGVVIRPARVYGCGRGAVAAFQQAARAEGVVRYVGDGENRWPLVHVDDVAELYLLALNAPRGSLYCASAESVKVKVLAAAAAAGARLESIPLETARQTMGPLADALMLDQVISSRKAETELGWRPLRSAAIQELQTS